jgi:hypothetical protein
MEKNQIVKGLTLFTFVSLITLFVTCRSGVFNKDSSDAGTTEMDSLSPPNTMIPSSKSMIIRDYPPMDKDTAAKDTLPDPKRIIIPSSKSGIILEPSDLDKPIKPTPEKDFVIPSSKSGIIVKPSDLKKPLLDSALLKELEQKKSPQNQQKQQKHD